jgi:hypothetical protein
VSAIRRAVLAVLFAPVLVVAWFLLRIWWVARLSVTRTWSAIAAIGRGILYAVLAVVTGIRDAIRNGIRNALALVRAAFAAGVRGVLGAAAFVVGTVRRAIQSTVSGVLGVYHAVLRLALGAVHAITSSIAAVGRRVWRVITGIRDAAVAAAAAGVALVTRASRSVAAPVVIAARGLWFITARSFRTLVVTATVVGFLAWRGLLLVLGGAAIVTGTLFGLVLVSIYGVRLLATTAIALARAVGPARRRVARAAAAGVAAVGHGMARGVAAFGSAVRDTARLGGAAVLRLAERALTTGRQTAHAGALRGAAGLAAAAAASTRAVHAAATGTRAAAAYSAREAFGLVRTANRAAAARLLVASGVGRAPVVRVNFAAVPGRSGDVRVATRLALVSTAAFMLIGGGLALLLTRQPLRPSPPPAVAALQVVPIPLAPVEAVRREPAAVAPRPPAPDAEVPAAAARRAPEPPVTIAPEPAPRSTLSAARVRAIWDKSDTRSLDRAIAEMRSATLAFRRCEMRMTSADAATATCNESASPRVAWTFDFRRNDDRWSIEGVSTTATPPMAR